MDSSDGSPALIRVFVASPDDVAPEREILERIVRDLNLALEVHPNPLLKIELRRWETVVVPGAGIPQEVINKQIGPYDVFVGVMWRRFGTPTRKASSGTEEEYERAYRSWEKRKRPKIMFYFSTAAASPPKTIEEAKQLMRVVRFRARIRDQQLIGEYDGTSNFDGVVRPHLTKLLRAFAEKEEKNRRKRERVLDVARRGIRQAVRIGTRRSENGRASKEALPPAKTTRSRQSTKKKGGSRWRKSSKPRSKGRKPPPQRRSV
jgi:hypothetical protein